MEHVVGLTHQTEKWLRETLLSLNCENIDELTVGKCRAPVKEKIGTKLDGALRYIKLLNDRLIEVNSKAFALQDQVVSNQNSVINLQKELLDCKEMQLSTVTSSVASSVQETVKAELRSYSAVVSNGQTESSITPANISSVVKRVVEEEDRGRNIMLFGLKEENNEVLEEKVNAVMEIIGEKPKMEACRIGKSTSQKPRPIKVTLSSSLFVTQILSKARRLKENTTYSSVFLSPDRSHDQRAEYRVLIADLKQRRLDEPNKRHFIRDGVIRSLEKT